MSDAELLARFVSRQEAAAFEELVRRHGPMVMRVCQRVLAHTQDAEDAFQAAFIVLARKASGIAKQGSVGSWLYGVAYRVALQIKENTSKHRLPAQGIDGRTIPDARQTPAAVDGETRAILDQELNRLPEKYRAPLVLCYLEGKTTDEAARELGCPTGTVAGRLPRARDLLRDRLTRRGMAVSGAALATLRSCSVASNFRKVTVRLPVESLILVSFVTFPFLMPAAGATASGLISALTCLLWTAGVTTAPTSARFHGSSCSRSSPAANSAGRTVVRFALRNIERVPEPGKRSTKEHHQDADGRRRRLRGPKRMRAWQNRCSRSAA
jgi:RNA polymerase sigma factor (sigma-70 family)